MDLTQYLGNSDELRNWATVLAAAVALTVFIVNSILMVRNRHLTNVSRFISEHRRLFDTHSYMAVHLAAMDAGTHRRNRDDPAMEAKFQMMLLEIERLAMLGNNRAVPALAQVYMFGTYARQILPLLTEQERRSMNWELAVAYLERLSRDSEKFEQLTPRERQKYWR